MHRLWSMIYKVDVKIARSRLSFFLIFFSYFHFIFDLFSYLLFIELRIRVDNWS